MSKPPNNASPSLDSFSDRQRRLIPKRHEVIDPAAEHYQTNPLALSDLIVRSQAAYNPPGETTCYLHNRMP